MFVYLYCEDKRCNLPWPSSSRACADAATSVVSTGSGLGDCAFKAARRAASSASSFARSSASRCSWRRFNSRNSNYLIKKENISCYAEYMVRSNEKPIFCFESIKQSIYRHSTPTRDSVNVEGIFSQYPSAFGISRLPRIQLPWSVYIHLKSISSVAIEPCGGYG